MSRASVSVLRRRASTATLVMMTAGSMWTSALLSLAFRARTFS